MAESGIFETQGFYIHAHIGGLYTRGYFTIYGLSKGAGFADMRVMRYIHICMLEAFLLILLYAHAIVDPFVASLYIRANYINRA